MIFSLKQSTLTPIPKITNHRTISPAKSFSLPPLSAPKINKPLHVSSIQTFGSLLSLKKHDDQREKSVIVCKAYEADGEFVVEKTEAAKRVKIGFYFATWWFLNVIFNIYNKKVLNAFPYPWLTSTLSLAAGSAIMLISWATKVAEPPTTDLDFWKALFPENKTFRHLKFFCGSWFLKKMKGSKGS